MPVVSIIVTHKIMSLFNYLWINLISIYEKNFTSVMLAKFLQYRMLFFPLNYHIDIVFANWLYTPSYHLKVYVTNRTVKIQKLVPLMFGITLLYNRLLPAMEFSQNSLSYSQNTIFGGLVLNSLYPINSYQATHYPILRLTLISHS